jgi:glutathione synthase/RimK-type ligase-like ATP-grasp enzyme
MKKILFLDNYKNGKIAERPTHIESFINAIDIKECEIFYSSLDNLDFIIINNQPSIHDNLNGVDLETYDMVMFRNTHLADSLDAFLAVEIYLRCRGGVDVIDGLKLAGAFIGKLSQMYLFAFNGIVVPNTVMSRRNLDAALNKADIDTPFIFKANDGIKGNRNYLMNSTKEVEQVYNKYNGVFIAQKFIGNDGDYRVLYVGNRNAPLIFYRRNQGKVHVNNTSQGGSAVLIPNDEFDVEALKMANKVFELSGKSLVGVDLIQDKNSGKWFTLESNTTPALYSGAFLNEKQDMFVNFLEYLNERNDA